MSGRPNRAMYELTLWASVGCAIGAYAAFIFGRPWIGGLLVVGSILFFVSYGDDAAPKETR